MKTKKQKFYNSTLKQSQHFDNIVTMAGQFLRLDPTKHFPVGLPQVPDVCQEALNASRMQ